MLSIRDIVKLSTCGYERRYSVFKSKYNLDDKSFKFIKDDVNLKLFEIKNILKKDLVYLKPVSGLFYKNKSEILVTYYREIFKLLVHRYSILNEESCVFYLLEECYDVEYLIRNLFYNQGMFSLITTDYLDKLSFALRGKRVLEVCGGMGYLSKGLLDRGIVIRCTDDKSWHALEGWSSRNYIATENLDALKALDKYVNEVDVVLVSWIPFGSNLDQLLLKSIRESERKPLFFVIGERRGGCTGSEAFHNQLIEVLPKVSNEINKVKETWASIHDCLLICK